MIPPKLDFPIWVILLMLAVIFVPFLLSLSGIYYLTFKKFTKETLVIPAIIVFLLAILTIIRSWSEGIDVTIALIGFPTSLLISQLFYQSLGTFLFSSIIGLAINYLALFGLINFFQRLFFKMTAKPLE